MSGIYWRLNSLSIKSHEAQFGDLKNTYTIKSRSDQNQKERHQRTKADSASTPVRIREKTNAKLELLLRQANRYRLGKKVKVDDLVLYTLDLITEPHLAEICNITLSNKERVELLYRKIAKENRGITQDEFFGLLLDGQVKP